MGYPGVKLESVSPSFDCSVLDQPIDLSMQEAAQRGSERREKREITTEQMGGSINLASPSL